MELLNSTISSKSLTFPSKFPFPRLKTKTPSRLRISNSQKSTLCLPFSLSSPSRFRISAHFRGPTNRQNYLRKKLTEHQKVSPSSDFENSVHKSFDNESFASYSGSFSGKMSNLDANSEVVIDDSEPSGVRETGSESKSKLFGESLLLNKLEGWVEQYKKDVEFWGIGTGPIFTVFRDSKGKVEKVDVNENEILRRSGMDPMLYKEADVDVLNEVNSRISHAKGLAREMENGNDVILSNSSVVKFVASGGKSSILNFIQGVKLKPGLSSKLSRVGVMVVCGFFLISAVKRMFVVGDDNRQEHTRLEKEMLRRKIKSRMDKEKAMKAFVEVIQDSAGPGNVAVEQPRLDKQELMENIIKATGSKSSLDMRAQSGTQDIQSVDFDCKIQEIRTMARHARELEQRDSSTENSDGEDDQILDRLSKEKKMIQKLTLGYEISQTKFRDGDTGLEEDPSETSNIMSPPHDPEDDCRIFNDVSSTEKYRTQTAKITAVGVPDDIESSMGDLGKKSTVLDSLDAVKVSENFKTTNNASCDRSEGSITRRFRAILSVKEAREYLSKKHDKIEATVEHEARSFEEFDSDLTKASEMETIVQTSQRLDITANVLDPSSLTRTPGSISVFDNSSSKRTQYFPGKQEANLGSHMSETESPLSALPEEGSTDIDMSQEQSDFSKTSSLCSVENSDAAPSPVAPLETKFEENQKIPEKEKTEGVNGRKVGVDLQMPGTSSSQESSNRVAEVASYENRDNWIENNFHEFEPVIKKIGVGFHDNYMLAKENTDQDANTKLEMMQLISDADGSELEWMKDEKLREIVFKVRDNELAGRDPFHLINDEDKLAFFSGLEKKVEQENVKLLNLHEWVHSNIENLDYGADGISLYDPPEKIIPCWKGPPLERLPEFLKSSITPKRKPVAENIWNSDLVKHDEGDSLLHLKEPQSSDELQTTTSTSNQDMKNQSKSSRTPRTVIEGSDGSIRAGKKSGKEYWQHTKRWSQGFLESYNAETDPEIKAVMKDMGKDLNRWLTEKEIKEAADLMDKLPEKGQKFIKQKLDKVKREMEMFGPHAVVSKYREYADEKEEDYLWWLDLPYVLCIEMYTKQEGEEEVGFYSLEMAADLELDPKQYHVIAFEDARDCKNLCYIIQAHMEMLGNGNALVVAQQPKDAFREAKANGFGVTVIRKGELQLNVDQPLEEVEEQIAEIGSKIYHDKIMKERSLDISTVMKGVFGLKKPVRRKRLKRKLKNPAKSRVTRSQEGSPMVKCSL